ncbi:hypothetical protein DENSPDRAFT_710853 [Dentipellis sp. KUC8613]|nr:hypothetical protein DENSPDRAFT_710853 [Dentipellis sp. KUC8613]
MPQDDDRQALSSESQHLPMVRSAKRTRSPTSSDDSEEVDNVMRIVENVTQSPFFLGSPSLLKRVAWYMDTKGVRRLVEVEQESGARPKTAEIRWIAMISPEKFNLHVEGGWNEGFRLGPLEETKARGYLVEPETEPFGSSWKSTVTGAKHVTENARKTFGGILGENQIVLDLSGAICLKVRHTVYKRYDRLDKFQEAQKELNKSIGENTFLSMENWTCKNDTVQDYHDKIVAGNRQSGKNGLQERGSGCQVWQKEMEGGGQLICRCHLHHSIGHPTS